MRRVELWSVFRLSSLAFLALYVITLGAFALLWWIASNTGTVHNIEKFLRDVGFKNFHFDGPQLMAGFAAVGAVLVLAGSLLVTVTAALFNVLSEMTGGVGVVVIEEAPVAAQPPGGTRLAAGAAGDGATHATPPGGSMAGRGALTTSGSSAVGSAGAVKGSGRVRRARSVMGVAASRARRSIRAAARGLAGGARGAVPGSAVESGDGSQRRDGDGRGAMRGSVAESGDGSQRRDGDGRDAMRGSVAESGDGSQRRDSGGRGAEAAARSRDGNATK